MYRRFVIAILNNAFRAEFGTYERCQRLIDTSDKKGARLYVVELLFDNIVAFNILSLLLFDYTLTFI